MKYYIIKHESEKRWTAYKVPKSHLKILKDGYAWKGPYTNLVTAMMGANDSRSYSVMK